MANITLENLTLQVEKIKEDPPVDPAVDDTGLLEPELFWPEFGESEMYINIVENTVLKRNVETLGWFLPLMPEVFTDFTKNGWGPQEGGHGEASDSVVIQAGQTPALIDPSESFKMHAVGFLNGIAGRDLPEFTPKQVTEFSQFMHDIFTAVYLLTGARHEKLVKGFYDHRAERLDQRGEKPLALLYKNRIIPQEATHMAFYHNGFKYYWENVLSDRQKLFVKFVLWANGTAPVGAENDELKRHFGRTVIEEADGDTLLVPRMALPVNRMLDKLSTLDSDTLERLRRNKFDRLLLRVAMRKGVLVGNMIERDVENCVRMVQEELLGEHSKGLPVAA